MTGRWGPRLALAGFVVATLAVHGVVAWLSPLQGDDWRYLLSPTSRDGAGLARSMQLGDVWGYVLVRSTLFHAIVSPAVGVVLIFGVFTLSARRLPDPGRWSDVLGIALISAMIWIALPDAGVTWFHRTYVARQVYGAALVVWFLAALRCRWQRDGAAWRVVMLVAGLAAGATPREPALAAVIGAAIAVRRTPRSARRTWMVLALAGVLISFGYWRSRDLIRTFGRLGRNPARLEPLLHGGGQLIVLIALLVIATLLCSRLGSTAAATGAPAAGGGATRSQGAWGSSGPPDAGESLAWLGAWLGLGVFAYLGPRSAELMQLPATLALCIGALPYLSWLAGVRFVRWMLVCLAASAHLVAWTLALPTYRELHAEFRDRMAAIARTPAGQIATVRPYSKILPDFWSRGEDWAKLTLRSAVARERGLAGIDLAPPFRQLERSPDLELVLEVDDVSGDQLAAAEPPPGWPRELPPARREFAALIERLRAITGRGVTARLRVTGIDFAARAGRPILAAWSDGAAIVTPEVSRSRPDATGHAVVSVAPELAARLAEAWLVGPWGSEPVRCTAGRCAVTERSAERTVLVLCSADRCLAADAWVPRF